MKIYELPMVTKCYYDVHCPWDSLMERWTTDHDGWKVELQPDFQRGYVWTPEQQISYIENMLQGVIYGRDVWFNSPSWGSFEDTENNPLVCVDGQQRIGAIIEFMENRLVVFDKYKLHDFEDWERATGNLVHRCYVNLHVNNLKTKKQVLQWYLQLNNGGTVHTREELDKVRGLLEAEK